MKKKHVIVIGSGFGSSVSALRFAEAGHEVTILERGGWITRENFEADDDMLWQPAKGRYGMNEFKKRGDHIIPWLGAGVGGGSHVYAGTLKRREFFDEFPDGITVDELAPYYKQGEEMLDAVKYPSHAPYNQLPSYQIFREAEKKLKSSHPELVEEQGDILLGISYAPSLEMVGKKFTNRHGAEQQYSDPGEQKLLGGDIDVKNTLDKNYLFQAQEKGAKIETFKLVTKISPMSEGGYQVTWEDPREDQTNAGEMECDILICGAGAIGSTELLLQSKFHHKTLPLLSDQLGKTYFTNGDYVTFILPKKGLVISWVGVVTLIIGLILWNWIVGILGLSIYLLGWMFSDEKAKPDTGSTNSDYIRFKHRDGTKQGAYIEGGRYPTPVKAISAILMSLVGKFNPSSYETISKHVDTAGKYFPFFELLERSWPIPILLMGRDDAVGSFALNEEGEAEIDYPIEVNDEYVQYIEQLSKMFAKEAKSYFIPNTVAKKLKIVEVPHNMGGVSMGEDEKSGVVDTFGRVFGYDNLVVMDGSIMPCSLGPNPVGTILAFAERSMAQVIPQMEKEGKIST